MVDSGLTAELITPQLRESLAIRGSSGRLTTGLGAGGAVAGGDLVQLKGAAICCGDFAKPGAKELPLPPLTAVVTDFPQAHMGTGKAPVEGMLGMEVLGLFDTDFDFKAGRVRLWQPGMGAQVAAEAGLAELPAAVLNETGILGIRTTSTSPYAVQQPFVGIVDCGSSFSALNWSAAQLAGLPPKGDRAYANSPKIFGLGVDGSPQPLPTTRVQLTFAGEPAKDRQGNLSFAPPAPGWQAWDSVGAAVGDLPVFSQLLGDGRKPFTGPAALIGLDVLAQRRFIIGAGVGAQGRRRRLFIAKR
eukprot:jgi/Chrzof1/9646/Cz04g10250.t1